MKKSTQKLKKITRVLFGRTAFVIIAILMQFAFFFILINWLYRYSVLIHLLFVLLGMFVVIHIFNEDTNSAFKMAWIIPVLIIPIFGTMIYVFVNLQLGTKIMRSRLASIDKQLHEKAKTSDAVLEKLKSELHGELGLASYLHNAGDFPAYYDNDIEFFPLGEFKFEEMKKQLMAAEKFIFMEYFIVTDSYMWRSILDILKLKASQGVEVRFMYDGMCSLALLPYGYYKELENMGIKSRPFSQIKPVLSTVQNNRDHRKILIVDGKTAFTGGINLADEYIDKLDRFGHWKDNAIKITGDAVSGYTSMFLQMWNTSINKVKEDNYDKYINSVSDGDFKEGDGYIIPFADSPLKKDRFGETMYINNLNLAKDYVHIMTPYLVLGTNMMQALKFAAKRGVDVKIILPHIPDKPYAFWLAGTYYRELLGAGVKIYEYTPGFVHSKMSISDDKRAIIGTINHDYRSLYLHYECAAYLVDVPQIKDMESDFVHTLSLCEEVTEDTIKNRSLVTRILGRVIRLIAPLL